MSASALSTAVVSIASTRRGRFFWAAWWSAPPARVPFRKPDASNGGAHSHEAARAEAERAAGRALADVDVLWARGWMRILRGEAPFTERQARAIDDPGGAAAARRARAVKPVAQSIWELLGVAPTATDVELKRAFRRRALETHPDVGGDAETFRRVREAYQRAVERRARRVAR